MMQGMTQQELDLWERIVVAVIHEDAASYISNHAVALADSVIEARRARCKAGARAAAKAGRQLAEVRDALQSTIDAQTTEIVRLRGELERQSGELVATRGELSIASLAVEWEAKVSAGLEVLGAEVERWRSGEVSDPRSALEHISGAALSCLQAAERLDK